MESKLYKVVVGTKIMDNFNYSLHVHSPINGEIVGSIPRITNEFEIDQIFKNAKLAFNEYKKSTFNQRKKQLLTFCNLLKEDWDETSNIIVKEIAKTKHSAIQEIDRTIDYIKQTIDEYEKIINNPLIIDETIHNIKGKKGTFIYEPIGVVLAISPFNYPLNLLMSKLAPALISGNVVVFKPATQGSCLGAHISMLLYKAGFNNGEISCIIGKGSEIGDLVITNSNIDMISFTGSTNIGKKIAQSNPFIPVVLELGGKDAAIVLKDADLKLTAQKIIKGAFDYNGQRCTGIKRVLVDSSIESKFVELMDEEVAKLTVGSANDGNFNITEMINSNAVKYNLELVHDALKNGGLTNQNIKVNGNILHPIILHNINQNCRIAWEEQFGPVLPIRSFKSIDEAIEITNKSEYGLQASIFTSNIELAKKLASSIEVFTVNINSLPSRGPDIFPFGARKNSGKGLQGIKDAIISMNHLKGIIENE